MTTRTYGWCGKILKIDLSELRISELKTMDYADRFLGEGLPRGFTGNRWDRMSKLLILRII